MAYNFEFPYTDSGKFNDDWLLNMLKNLIEEFNHFVNLNKIKYADPILWDITRQYEVNTVVIDPQTGDAYISVKAVPYGVSLGDMNYWTKIFNYANSINTLQEQIAAANEGLSKTATANRSIEELVWLDGLLYKVIAPMIAGDTYVEGSNVQRITIEETILDYVRYVLGIFHETIGDLDALNTVDKSRIVAAINEVLASLTSAAADLNGKIGTLSELNTVAKSNLVAAINEVLASLTSAAIDINNRINSVYSDSERSLSARHFLVCGDSYGDEDGEWPFYTQLFLDVDDNHWHDVCEGGAGFVSNGTILFINQIMNYTGNKNEITDILVCGGANDSVSNDAGDSWWIGVQNNMKAFDDYVKANYPNAKVHLGFIASGIDYLQGGVVSGRVYACREMCKYYYNNKGSELGWHILNNVDLALSQTVANISSDGLHPSIFGSNALGHAISQAILTGTCEIIYPETNACDATQFGGNSQFKYVVRNHDTLLTFRDFYITTTSNITNTFKVAKMNSLGFNQAVYVPCIARIDNFDNLDYQIIPATLCFSNDDVYLSLEKITDDGTYKTSFVVDSGETGYVRVLNIDITVPTRIIP